MQIGYIPTWWVIVNMMGDSTVFSLSPSFYALTEMFTHTQADAYITVLLTHITC